MPFENVEINHRNFTVDVLDGSGFYTMDHINNKLTKKTSSGTLVSDNFLDVDVSEVYALAHDGAFFWSLERTGANAALIRKWQVGSDTLVRQVLSFSMAPDAVNRFDSYTMAVEWYKDTLSSGALVGATSITVTDGSIIRVGDKISLGPSTAVGHVGSRNFATVVSKLGNTLTITPALSSQFSPIDPLFFTRSIFLFSDVSQSGLNVGSVYKIDNEIGSILAVDSSQLYGLVRAATFFKDKVMFMRGAEVVWLNQDTFRIFKSQAVDNLDGTRGSYYSTYALTGFSDTLYRLERQKVVYNSGTGNYDTTTWASYNYNTSSSISETFFVGVKADPPIIHKAATGISPTPTSSLVIEVLDQFRTPLFNKFVQLVSDGGSVSPSSGSTDINGLFKSTYTANSVAGQVTITATVI
jgi:hypothetical protein